MADRYFVEIPISEDRVVLAGSEAHHLIHVMRAERGVRVVLFDGTGAEFVARVDGVGRKEVELTVLDRSVVDRELPVNLTLGVALPKGDRQRWLVEKAVELGVRRLVPLQTTRSVSRPTRQAPAQLQRTVVEASKQCGRNRLMAIARPQNWAQYVADTRQAPCRLLAHPRARGQDSPKPSKAEFGKDAVYLAVGPEGGFTEEEVSLAVAAGWRTVDLGPRILRVETAALLMVATAAESCFGEPGESFVNES